MNDMNNKFLSIIKKTVWVSVSLIIIGACTKDFDEINKNPNAYKPENVQPSFLLAQTMAESVLDPGMHERMTQLINDVFAQYYANEGFSPQQGLTNDEWITEFYNNYHGKFVASLNEAIRVGRKSGKQLNDTQISRIWRVWVYSRATDLWGDIPYFKAADGSGENAPYDKQEDIYKDMLKELDEAVDSLSTSNPPILPGQDYVYNDDIAKWKKFGNSLRLRLAIRVSVVDPALAKQHGEDAIAKGVFTSSGDACLMPRTNDFGWGNAYQYTYFYGWGAESMSRSMENLLTGLGGQPFPNPPPSFTSVLPLTYDDPGITLTHGEENTIDPNTNKFKSGVPSTVDPRGPIYFNVTSMASGAKVYTPGDFKTGVLIKHGPAAGDTIRVSTVYRWHGVPAGLGTGAAGRTHYGVNNTARLGVAFSKDLERDYEVMTYHEVCFLLAEGAQRGWNVGGGSAQSWYENGIRASMKWHGVADATIDAYLTSTAENTYGTTVSFTNTSPKTFLSRSVNDEMSKIITQKYIALFPDGGWETWADHRRLHLPVLVPFAGGLDPKYTVRDGGPDNFTKRITYPAIEGLNNKAFYDAAIGRQGADKETTNLWWDKN